MLVLVVLGVVGVGVFAWEPVWWWVTTERAFFEEEHNGYDAVRGWKTKRRWSPNEEYGPWIGWYVETGLKAGEGTLGQASNLRGTYWKTDGTIRSQSLGPPDYQRISPCPSRKPGPNA